ncbi:putative membrane protein YphA (DoxX/SURF4 family) [Amycolatopsis sulphurea]|uniref:Putative membrane protein YphA (DoxX/SURF4 family) n=1 Tax=Amycolatopsis sulphurea TaxID=76022 RepID=A0A2A9FCD7_9PSEU|nr:DoxX family protein [Amycolatopsis sulphurea]PFG48421.1 putative membrane protein YphA (DoxX/SURF4 family) [Amycolatopsis sulphurea]
MILRRAARPLLASIFIFGGIGALRDVQGHAKAAEPLITGAFDKADGLVPERVPRDPATLVRIDAAVKIGAGFALATGRAPRLAAVALLGSLVPTTLASHRFWAETDPVAKAGQQVHFLKNAGLAGGLLLAVGDTAGKPSLGWRARRAAKKAGKRAERLGKKAERSRTD